MKKLSVISIINIIILINNVLLEVGYLFVLLKNISFYHGKFKIKDIYDFEKLSTI